MRAVGARASLRQVQRAELAGVGLLAGFWRPWWRWRSAGDWRAMCLTSTGPALDGAQFLGNLAGAVLALSARLVEGLRAVLNTPVVETLRKSQ